MRSRTRIATVGAMIGVLALAPLAVTKAQDGGALPDAAAILDRYVEVTGGTDAYENRQSQIVHGTMEMAAAGVTGALTIYQDGDNQYTSMDLPGVGVVESGVTDGVAWENSVLMGARIKSGAERAQAIREATIDASVRWQELFPQVETVGVETIGGEDAYQVVLTPEEGSPQSMFFSVESGLVLRIDVIASTPMGDIPLQMTVGDYRDFDGILTPTTVTQSVAGQTIRISLESVDANAAIPAERFELPGAVAALLE